jgi:hypothetical protein
MKAEVSLKNRMKTSSKLLRWPRSLSVGSAPALAGLALLASASRAPAASVGDYQCINTGNWSDNSIWQTWNGSSWVAASAAPSTDAIANLITISGTNLVTCDTSLTAERVVVAAGAELDVPIGNTLTVVAGSGTGLDIAGILGNMGTVTNVIGGTPA